MKKLILLAVLGLFVFSCDPVSSAVDDNVGSNSNEISEVSEVPEVHTFNAYVLYHNNYRLLKKHASQEACKLELRTFLENNLDFFKTNSRGVRLCCLFNDLNYNENNACIHITDFLLFKGTKTPLYYTKDL